MRIGIITISDRSALGERSDLSGPAIEEEVVAQGWLIIKKVIIPDDLPIIRNTLLKWVDSGDMDVVLTTGGTGFSSRDVTPEATKAVIDREAPGLAEAMRAASLKVTPHAMLSRATAGIRGKTLIVNLPGSPRAAVENLRVIVPVLNHAIELLSDDPKSEEGHRHVKR